MPAPRNVSAHGVAPRQLVRKPAGEPDAPAPAPPPPPPRRSRRGWLIAASVVLVANLAVGAYLLDGLADSEAGTSGTPAALPLRDDQLGLGVDVPSPTRSRVPSPPLSLPGEVPTEGPGTFQFARGKGEVLGESGAVQRFRVAVEDDAGEDPDEFATFVEEVLADAQGWTAGGEFRFRRVPEGAEHDFTIHLATSQTTDDLCAAAGLSVRGPDLPEGGVSCRVSGQVNLNLSRWRHSVPQYVDAEVTLETYRQMLVNHEVGHQLGYGHESCPGEGALAPVMQQQSIFLGGCEANPWPYPDGDPYLGVGDPVP